MEDVLNGYNGTIMAYGQTGAGKTYTLSSIQPEAIGMIPRAAAEIFAYISTDVLNEYTVFMSYIQIYMEMIQVRPNCFLQMDISPLIFNAYSSMQASGHMQSSRQLQTLLQLTILACNVMLEFSTKSISGHQLNKQWCSHLGRVRV